MKMYSELERLDVSKKQYEREIIFLSYRGVPPRAPNVRSHVRIGEAASEEGQRARHPHLSLLNNAIFGPRKEQSSTIKGSNVS